MENRYNILTQSSLGPWKLTADFHFFREELFSRKINIWMHLKYSNTNMSIVEVARHLLNFREPAPQRVADR